MKLLSNEPIFDLSFMETSVRLTNFFRVGASENPVRAVVDGARNSVSDDL